MRVKTFYRMLRIVSAVVLFFFVWTFGQVWQAAAWASERQKPDVRAQKTDGSRPEKIGTQTAEGRFEKAVEALRKDVDRAGKKADKDEDITAEVAEVKAKKAEIESLDNELRKEFSATEKKLKDARLPKEILDRHYAFVKHYETNLAQLKTEINDIEKPSATGHERRAALEKARLHLEKIKPPKHHKLFNPSSLPAHTRKLKPVRISWLDKAMDWLVPSAEAAENPPTAVDLSETLETPQSQEIRDLAQQLGGTSVSLYEYVRNAFSYEPYAGSVKGAVQTLHEKSGNEWDQASLLIALYRASGIPARYVVGTVDIPVDAAMSWLGVEDPMMAGTLLLTMGRPTSLVYSGSKIAYIRTQQVWVRAYVPFLYSRGATTGPGDMWVDVDPSFKGQTVTKTLTVDQLPAFDQTAYLSTFRTESSFDFYKSQLQTFLASNSTYSGYVSEALAWNYEITPERFGVLIGQPPYIIRSIIGTYDEIPDSYRQKFTLSITDPATGDSLLYYSAPMPQIIGKRMTLSYIPATDADQAVINNYGGLYSTPPYLVQLRPEIKIEGVSMVQGNAIGSGQEQNMEFVFDTTIDQGRVDNTILAGGYYAIGLSARRGDTRENILERTNQLAQLAGTIDFNDPATLDQKLGEILYLSATVYHQNLDSITKQIASFNHVVDVRDVSEMMYFLTLKVDSAFGMPTKITPAGITGDMDRNLHTVVPVDGDMSRIKWFMQLQGNESSFLEHDVTEKIYQTEALSAVKGIQLANDQGIPVHTINSQNIGSELSTLQISSDVIADIANAVNAGQEVIVPERNLTIGDWTGIGYIIQDPNNGKGAYLISGGYGGAATIDMAATEDTLRATMTDFASWLQHPTMARQVRFPGPDNRMYTSDDVIYSEVSLLELDQAEYDDCSTKGDPGCIKRYSISHADVAQPLIDSQQNGGVKLTAHITADNWRSQDGARYMRAGTAVLLTVEWMIGYFFTEHGGDGTPQIGEPCCSGYRTYTHNLELVSKGSSTTSHHVDGIAADTQLQGTNGSTVPDPKRCEILQEVKFLTSSKGEVLAEGAKTTVHVAVPATKPHTDEDDYANQWRCE